MQTDAAWSDAAQGLPIIVWSAKPDGRFEFVNRRFGELTGAQASDVPGRGWIDAVHPDDAARALDEYEHAIAAATPFSVDVRVRIADGSYRWMRSQSMPMRDSNGGVVRWFGVLLDIDESYRATERFRVLAEAIPIIVWSAEPQGWIDWYNGHWYDYTGQTREESAGWGWQAAHHADDFPKVIQRWQRCIETGEPFEMEFRLRRHDGVFRWFLTRAEPLRDVSGAVVRWYGSNVDIHSQKIALERSKRIAETLQNVFLPSDLPSFRNLRFDAAYIAAEKDALVGGDWYDAFELPDGRVGFSIGDVAGHGLAASVLVGRLRQAIYTLAFKGEDPASILSDTNAILSKQNPDTFVTAIVGFVSPAHDAIVYANAGHPRPLFTRKGIGTAEMLGGGGPALGVSDDAAYRNQQAQVDNDTIVLLYTDGMTEYARAIDAAEEKLKAASLLLVRDPSVAHPAHAIQELVLDGSATNDDAALLVLHFADFSMNPKRVRGSGEQRTWRFHSSDAYSAHAFRSEIMSYLRMFGEESGETFAAELVAGELLANTVEHAPGLVEIHIAWQDAKPVMTVRDSGPGMQRLSYGLPDSPFEENGRGLFLVKQLAEAFEVRASPGFGTEVRVTLPLRRIPLEEETSTSGNAP